MHWRNTYPFFTFISYVLACVMRSGKHYTFVYADSKGKDIFLEQTSFYTLILWCTVITLKVLVIYIPERHLKDRAWCFIAQGMIYNMQGRITGLWFVKNRPYWSNVKFNNIALSSGVLWPFVLVDFAEPGQHHWHYNITKTRRQCSNPG